MDARRDDITRLGTLPLAPVHGSTRAQRRLALGLIGCVLVGLVPAFVWAAPASHWDDWGLLGGLWSLAACTVLGEVALKQAVPVQFHSLGALAVLTLLVGGPLPALIAWLLPDLAGRLLLRRYRLLTPGLAANVASYGWCVLAGAGVLALTHAGRTLPDAAPSVLAVGFTLELVNFAIARGLYGTLYQGYRLVALLRDELLSVLGPELATLTFATVCALLLDPLGTFVLAVVAPSVLIPQLALPMLARSRSVTTLRPEEATKVYVHALAAHLGIDRRTRRTTLAATPLLHAPATIPKRTRRPHVRRVQIAAWHASERWDGQGTPAAFAGRLIPLASRLLAVAHAWSELTAAGESQLPQGQAMLALELQAATRLDPTIVQAAGEIVTTETAFAQIETFQPKLHTLPLPRLVREDVLPQALARYAPA